MIPYGQFYIKNLSDETVNFNFSNKISRNIFKPDKKFTVDMTYDMHASGSYLLTNIVDRLHEDSKKINSVDRLSGIWIKAFHKKALSSHLSLIRKCTPDQPVVHIDDSDIVKPDGRAFEALGIVRDGPKSTNTKNVYEKGYHVTEACVLTKNNHPVSIFSKIHSSKKGLYLRQ